MKQLMIALSALGFATGVAFAQAPAFDAVDANGDGLVSMEEGAAAGFAWTDDQFKAADTDGDGGLSADEYTAASAQ